MIISKTPFRVSFAGGGSDRPEFYRRGYGAVVSTAIDQFVYLAVHRFFEPTFLLKYSRTEVCATIDAIQHPLIRECLRITDTKDHLEITSFADIPAAGSGLGSSSAFAVGLIHALLAHQGHSPSAETCADRACEVEIERLGEPIGKQDQYAAAYGGMNYIRFKADDTVRVEPIALDPEMRNELEQRLVLFYTGITRKASGILAQEPVEAALEERRLNVLTQIRDQADALQVELVRGNLGAIGTMLHEGWLLKRQTSDRVSSRFFDDMYRRARSGGATGGKLLGAGGGGFFLAYVEPHDRARLIATLSDLRHVDFRFEHRGTRIISLGD